MANWRVVAELSSPLAGDPPYLDGLLEHEMSQRHGRAMRLTRGMPAPPIGMLSSVIRVRTQACLDRLCARMLYCSQDGRSPIGPVPGNPQTQPMSG